MNLIVEHHIFVIRCCCCFRRNYNLNVQGPTFSSKVIIKKTPVLPLFIYFFFRYAQSFWDCATVGIWLRLKTLKWSKKALFCTCVSNLHTKQTCKTSYLLLSFLSLTTVLISFCHEQVGLRNAYNFCPHMYKMDWHPPEIENYKIQ